MKEVVSGNLKICYLENYEEYLKVKNSIQDCDLIIFDEWQQGLIKYPSHVSFKIFLPETFDNFLNSLNKKNRYYLKNYYEDVQKNFEVKVSEEIDREEFNEWYDGYKKFMNKKEFGADMVSEKWIERSLSLAKSIFFYKNNKIEGGCIFREVDDRISMAYAWYSPELRKSGGATYILYYLLTRCYQKNIKTFSFGRDPNLYGGRISLGIYDFKSKWNSTITLSQRHSIQGLLVNTKQPIIFYSLDENNNLQINKININ